jgi:glycosyltransferase involved in cell wall biosynthesis
MDNHFKIIVPLYNSEDWINKCILSIKTQNYKNFKCIILDDLSTDDSLEIARSAAGNDERFKVIKHEEKCFALRNIYKGIAEANPEDEDIIVNVDGDDWLASENALSIVNSVYKMNNCWMTYGSYMEYPGGQKGVFAKQAPEEVIQNNAFRKHHWIFSHLRTYKYHLWKQIKEEDFKDDEGNFYRMAGDLALMYPMLEMSGERACYIDDILYVYNASNPLNEHKVDHATQLRLEQHIRSRIPRLRIESLIND